jgi:hypothetical protein
LKDNKWLKDPPPVDGLRFEPKFPCSDANGYHITESELELFRCILTFIAEFRDAILQTDLSATLRRFNNSVPIDDATLIPPGDGIASLGPHTDNPGEDIETVARISALMRHMCEAVEEQKDSYAKMSDEEYAKERDRRIAGMRNRLRTFARNIDTSKFTVSNGNPVGKCDCDECLEAYRNHGISEHSRDPIDVAAVAMARQMDIEREERLGRRKLQNLPESMIEGLKKLMGALGHNEGETTDAGKDKRSVPTTDAHSSDVEKFMRDMERMMRDNPDDTKGFGHS